MARSVERCRDCTPGTRCRWHLECSAQIDAQIAADIGRVWAGWVWDSIDIRRPWPNYDGRCSEIAARLASWLTRDEARRELLGEVCCWQASITWEALQAGMRDKPFRATPNPSNERPLPGREHIVLRFRPRKRVVPLARTALTSMGERAGRFRAAQGLRDPALDQVDGLAARTRSSRR
jgi:hypothetical protein